MPSGRKKGDHGARRSQIAEATCNVILKAGVERAGIADIAREMKCSTGVLMHYFESKAQMLLYAKNLLFDHVYAAVQTAGEEHSGLEMLHAMAMKLVPADAAAIDRWRVLTAFNGLAIGSPELQKAQASRNARFAKLFASAIKRLQRAEILPSRLDPLAEGAGIVALVDGIAGQVVMDPRAWPVKRIGELIQRHLRALLHATK